MAKSDVKRDEVATLLHRAIGENEYDPSPSMRRVLDLCFEVPLGWLIDECHVQLTDLRAKVDRQSDAKVGSMIAAEMELRDQIRCANLQKGLWVALTYSHYREWPKDKLADWLGLSQS